MAADSGKENDGMRSVGVLSSSGTPCADMKTVNIGFAPASRCAAAMIARATSSAWVTSGGTQIATTASTSGSSATASMVFRYASAGADAIISTGLRTLASGGRNARRRSEEHTSEL